jgi:PRTRC genetic system ThiF family protein
MSHSLQALGHAGFDLTLWDDDIVTQANQGRQLFAPSEVGLPKAASLIVRCNRFFGTGWKAASRKFEGSTKAKAAIYISCVDTAAARFGIAQALEQAQGSSPYRDAPRYWMDFGNSKDSGQVILSTIGSISQPPSEKFETVAALPFVTEEFGQLLRDSEQGDNAPSCSLAEALEKQDLFINSTLAQMGCSLLWQLFRQGMTQNRGLFLNLKTFYATPLPC